MLPKVSEGLALILLMVIRIVHRPAGTWPELPLEQNQLKLIRYRTKGAAVSGGCKLQTLQNTH